MQSPISIVIPLSMGASRPSSVGVSTAAASLPPIPVSPSASSPSLASSSSSSSSSFSSSSSSSQPQSFPLSSPTSRSTATPTLPSTSAPKQAIPTFNIHNVTINPKIHLDTQNLGPKDSAGGTSSSTSPSSSSAFTPQSSCSSLPPSPAAKSSSKQLPSPRSDGKSSSNPHRRSTGDQAVDSRSSKTGAPSHRNSGSNPKPPQEQSLPKLPHSKPETQLPAQAPALVTPATQPTFVAPAFVISGSGPFDVARLFPSGMLAQPIYSPIKPDLGLTRRGSVSSKKIGSAAEKRANHNAIERARRDSLNSRFQEIAELVPQLRELKKPSKSVIMQKTLEYVRTTQKRMDANHRETLHLKKENEKLRAEVKSLKTFILKMQNLPYNAENLDQLESIYSPLPSTPPQEESTQFSKCEGLKGEQDDYTRNEKFDPSSLLQGHDDEPKSEGFDDESQESEGEIQDEGENEMEQEMQDLDSEIPDLSQVSILGSDPNLYQHLHCQIPEQMDFGETHSMSDFSSINSTFEQYGLGGFGAQPQSLTNNFPDGVLADSFDFDTARNKVEVGLHHRHDKSWLRTRNIMKEGEPALQATQKAMEFHVKKQTLNSRLSSRPSVEDLIGMHIMQQD